MKIIQQNPWFMVNRRKVDMYILYNTRKLGSIAIKWINLNCNAYLQSSKSLKVLSSVKNASPTCIIKLALFSSPDYFTYKLFGALTTPRVC